MENNTGIRQFRDGDEIGILNVLKQLFSTWPALDLEFSPLEHWVWKYKSNPYGKMIVFVFEDNGEIIGCWHRILSQMKIGEDEVLASMGADVAILPKLQGKGYSSKIREVMLKTAHEAGNYFVFGFTPNPILSKSAYRAGFSAFPYSIKEYVWVKDVNSFLKRRDKSWLKKGLAIIF